MELLLVTETVELLRNLLPGGLLLTHKSS